MVFRAVCNFVKLYISDGMGQNRRSAKGNAQLLPVSDYINSVLASVLAKKSKNIDAKRSLRDL